MAITKVELTATSGTWNSPSGASYADICIINGGSGGCGGSGGGAGGSCGSSSGGSGGGGGGRGDNGINTYAWFRNILIIPSTSYVYTIGSGGVGGSGGAGGPRGGPWSASGSGGGIGTSGGITTFGSCTCAIKIGSNVNRAGSGGICEGNYGGTLYPGGKAYADFGGGGDGGYGTNYGGSASGVGIATTDSSNLCLAPDSELKTNVKITCSITNPTVGTGGTSGGGYAGGGGAGRSPESIGLYIVYGFDPFTSYSVASGGATHKNGGNAGSNNLSDQSASNGIAGESANHQPANSGFGGLGGGGGSGGGGSGYPYPGYSYNTTSGGAGATGGNGGSGKIIIYWW